MLKEVLRVVKTSSGHPYTLKTLGQYIPARDCITGCVTGKCSKPGCMQRHTFTTEDAAADKIAGMLKQCRGKTPKEKKDNVKKEKSCLGNDMAAPEGDGHPSDACALQPRISSWMCANPQEDWRGDQQWDPGRGTAGNRQQLEDALAS